MSEDVGDTGDKGESLFTIKGIIAYYGEAAFTRAVAKANEWMATQLGKGNGLQSIEAAAVGVAMAHSDRPLRATAETFASLGKGPDKAALAAWSYALAFNLGRTAERNAITEGAKQVIPDDMPLRGNVPQMTDELERLAKVTLLGFEAGDRLEGEAMPGVYAKDVALLHLSGHTCEEMSKRYGGEEQRVAHEEVIQAAINGLDAEGQLDFDLYERGKALSAAKAKTDGTLSWGPGAENF